MLAKTYSYGICGLDAYPVTIEVDARRGLPCSIIVGLPDPAIRESKERVRTAIKNSGYQYQPQRITVNLSPADIKKEGPAFDLAIALGILGATEQIDAQALAGAVFLGELSLDGQIRPITGALSIAMAVPAKKFQAIFLPRANAAQAALASPLPVYPVDSLSEVIHLLSHPDARRPQERAPTAVPPQDHGNSLDFADVTGQFSVKRGLEVAAAGAHNCLLIGPPGSGKTMLARRLPTILPDMSQPEALEVTRIYSVAGLLPGSTALIRQRPFRSPHHTASDVALVGGGTVPKPGEVTLSHHGVLFLDELPEFNRAALEALRQPLEDHFVTVARTARTVRFPAQFMFVASMNPCPCGFLTEPRKACQCSPLQVQRYLARISGPLLDRIDIHLEVAAVKTKELFGQPAAEPSAAVKQRTTQARAIQNERLRPHGLFANAQMDHRMIKAFCQLDPSGQQLLKQAIDNLGLSARAHDKILKVARTIADLAEEKDILPEHLAEAIQYRCLDRN